LLSTVRTSHLTLIPPVYHYLSKRAKPKETRLSKKKISISYTVSSQSHKSWTTSLVTTLIISGALRKSNVILKYPAIMNHFVTGRKTINF